MAFFTTGVKSSKQIDVHKTHLTPISFPGSKSFLSSSHALPPECQLAIASRSVLTADSAQ